MSKKHKKNKPKKGQQGGKPKAQQKPQPKPGAQPAPQGLPKHAAQTALVPYPAPQHAPAVAHAEKKGVKAGQGGGKGGEPAIDTPLTWSTALAVTFLAGIATMAIEMTASRLLAPSFGTSFAVWTNIIGVMMAALSVGYTIGGRLADRHPTPGVLSGIILVSGLWAALVPLIATALLRFEVQQLGLDEFPGSLLGTAVLFAPPIFLLGMVNPYAIRLATTDVKTVGALSGRVYSVSTIGSLVGTFLPVVLTIPLLGTNRTMYLFAALLIVTGLWTGTLGADQEPAAA